MMAMQRRDARMGAGLWLSYAAFRAASLVPFAAYRRYRFIAVPAAGMPKMPHDYRVEAADPGVLRGSIDAGPDTIVLRLQRGLTPLAAWRGERLVGVTWVTDAPFLEDEVRALYVPPPGAAWDTGLWIPERERMSRAFAALWAGTRDWLEARGLGWSLSRVTDYNLGSLRPHIGMRAVELGTAAFVALGPLQLASAGRPRVSLGAPTEFRFELPRA